MTMADFTTSGWNNQNRPIARLRRQIKNAFDGRPDVRSKSAPAVDACAFSRHHAPGHPVLCFAPDILAARAKRFLNEFPGQVTYAVKSNSSLPVLATLTAAGLKGFDVASVGEIEAVRGINPAAELHYHNPIKSPDEIASSYAQHNVRHFALDDECELKKIVTVADPANTVLAVRFRLKGTQAVHDFTTKFGATPDDAVKLLRKVCDAGFIPALTFHPGSQCYDPHAYTRHISAAAEIARQAGVELANLNVGGGFPAEYPGAGLPPLEAFFEAIRTSTLKAFGAHAPMLTCEPGRAMVAPSMSLLVQVKHVRNGSDEIFLSDGIYGALMELSQAPLHPPVRLIRDGAEFATGSTKPFTAYGPTCDPLDTLPAPLALPTDVRPGDYVELGFMGAYSCATATGFNGYGQIETAQVQSVFSG